MARSLKVSLIVMLALAAMLTVLPAPASAAGIYVRGGYGWGPAWGWGPGWHGYGPAYYGARYYYGPPAGNVKIETHDKNASVFIDGGYAGTVREIKKFSLRPGEHNLAVKAPNGQTIFNQRIEVLRGRTTKIHAGA